MKLPAEFLAKMEVLLGKEEFEQFVDSYKNPRYSGLRVNTLKISVDEFMKISPFKLEPIPWTKDGFYYSENDYPGKHPYYHAGLYYIQEPSAMLPGTILEARPGEKVLDLCAAPGGKSIQAAAGMQGKGILVSNDINYSRVKALVRNVELYGVRNVIVTNEAPEVLARSLEGYFDKILVDAPCSGEGMFRKDEEAVKSWEEYKSEKCCVMQWDILKSADTMLKPGGCIVYSTCTFSPEEDEVIISRFLKEYKNYELLDIEKCAGIESGRPDWCEGNINLSKTARLWPHKLRGEGHFAAMLKETGNIAKYSESNINLSQIRKDMLEALNIFLRDNLTVKLEGFIFTKGEHIYYLPEAAPNLTGIKVAKHGWHLGSFEKSKFIPSHSLLTALSKKDLRLVEDFNADSREASGYLKGETIINEGIKGYTGICVDGYTLGWAKQTGDMLKNLYPKGWRRMS